MFGLTDRSVRIAAGAAVLLLTVSCATNSPAVSSEKDASREAAERARSAAGAAFADKDNSPVSPAQTAAVPADNTVVAGKADSSAAVFVQTAAEPVWVKKPQSGADQNLYLCASGSGRNLQDAESSAISGIAKIIRQNISSRSITRTKDSFDSFSGAKSYSAIDEIIETETMVNSLVGVKITEFWESSNGLIHAFAVLNRKQAAFYYTEKIQEEAAAVEKLVSAADAAPGTFAGYVSLQRAVAAAEKVSEYMDILYAADTTAYKMISLPYESSTAVEARAFQFAAFVPIDIFVAGDEDNRIAASVAKVFTGYGFKPEIAGENWNAPYYCDVTVTLQDVPSAQNAFARYIFTAAVKDTASSAVYFSYSANGREGHLSQSEARQRAFRSLEKKITTDFADDFLASLRGE